MVKLFKNLKNYKLQVLLIVILLLLKAFCELALPAYTSDIVDVGIQQGGIENAVMDQMSDDTYSSIKMLLSEEDGVFFAACYQNKGDRYNLAEEDDQSLEELNKIMGIPEILLYYRSLAEEGKLPPGSMAGDMQQPDGGLAEEGQLPAGSMPGDTQQSDKSMTEEESQAGADKNSGKSTPAEMAQRDKSLAAEEQLSGESAPDADQLSEMSKAMAEQMAGLSQSMTDQIAVNFVKQEYEKLGVDMNKLQMDYLFKAGLFMLIVTLLCILCGIAVCYISSKAAAGVGRDLRSRIFSKVISFSGEEIDRFSTASLITRSTNDVQQIQLVIAILLRMVIYAPILGAGGIIKVLTTHTGLDWIIVVAVAAAMAVVFILMLIAMPRFKIMQSLIDSVNLVSREILTGLPVIRAFGREYHEESRFDESNQKLTSNQLFVSRAMTFMFPIMAIIMNGVSVMIVWFGSKGVDAGRLQVGDMIAFINYAIIIVLSFLMLSLISIMLPRAIVAAERVDEVISAQPSIADAAETKDELLEGGPGVIRFDHVGFMYPGASGKVIDDLSFETIPGKTTAIIGSTGSGKSTIINLIMRFYDVTSGSITIDGIDIREISQRKLRDMMGYVPQKSVLFSGTIGSNIGYGLGKNASAGDAPDAGKNASAGDVSDVGKKAFAGDAPNTGKNASAGDVSDVGKKASAGDAPNTGKNASAGSPEADGFRARILEAAEIAQASEFIEEKEEGINAYIAQGGSNVSGGQKQRLSIARAIAKSPKIYLFDDSFSALDYKTDTALRKALAEKTEGSSVIIVGQRISTIMGADQILVMDAGRLAGIGTHQELLAGCEEYREIARSQLSEKELEAARKSISEMQTAQKQAVQTTADPSTNGEGGED